MLQGCILWGSRVVIPKCAHPVIMDQLHETHPGVSRMKSLARSFVWWPGLDKQIEDCVEQCRVCQESRPVPAKAPIHPWEWPHNPWSRIHIDHAGPFLGHLYLVVVDSHSKWMDVQIVSSTSSEVTIKKLSELFAVHGIPELIVSDNGTGFTSDEFKSFVESNGISHRLTSPYHPASNRLAERAVQTFKNGVSRLEGTIQSRINQFLFHYRITPHTTTGVSPAELLMGRRLRCKLSLVHPDLSKRVVEQQTRMTAGSRAASLRTFQEGEEVYVKNFHGQNKWISGVVMGKIGFVSYRVKLTDGKVTRMHVDHLHSRFVVDPDQRNDSHLDDWPVHPPMPGIRAGNHQGAPAEAPVGASQMNATSAPRRSNRIPKPVDRFSPV